MRAGGGDFFGSPAKNRRIAGFQPHHLLALQGGGDDGRVNPHLRPAVRAHLFADKDAGGTGSGKGQNLRLHQPVIVDDIGLTKAAHRPHASNGLPRRDRPRPA